MNILLLSMPDSFEHMPSISIRMPNGALTSLAGNIDPHHKVAVADLVLAQRTVRETVCQLMESHDPELVGLSIMTFQRRTAMAIMDLVRSLKPDVRIVVGGYDPSLAPEVYTDVDDPKIDFLVKGEGEITFRELVRTLEGDGAFEKVKGLSFRRDGIFYHNAGRGVAALEGDQIRPPRRSARVLSGYTALGRQIDVIETSRGCTFDCSFCSIIEMRGRNFHRFDVDRVIDDIRDAYEHGARAIFFVDDNITLHPSTTPAIETADAELEPIGNAVAFEFCIEFTFGILYAVRNRRTRSRPFSIASPIDVLATASAATFSP